MSEEKVQAKRLKIVFLMGGLDSNGGIGRVVSIISDKMALYHEVTVITYFQYNENEALYSLNKKINIQSLHATSSMKMFLLQGGIAKLREIIRKDSYDYLIACGVLFFPITVLACARTTTKSVCWEHSNANNRADHGFQMLCRRIGVKHSNAVVTITKQDYEMYKARYHPANLYQIYNPVDERIKYGYQVNHNPKKIISVGRLTYQKNYPILLRVAKEVLDKHPDWIWDVYGEGEEKEEISTDIREKGLEGRVILKGQVNNLYERYKEYSFYVITSRYEGFGMALLEASRAGLPIISFDVECGPREIIKNDVNGYLVKEMDENVMIERVNYLCDHWEKCLELSANILHSKNPFDVNQIIKDWNQLFEQLLVGGKA